MMKIASCYQCRHWEADHAKPKFDGTLYAYCDNPEKERPETGSEPCLSNDNDFCMGFEPVGGWTDEWRRAFDERCEETEDWLEEFQSELEGED